MIRALSLQWIELVNRTALVGIARDKATRDYFRGAAEMADILGNTDLRNAILGHDPAVIGNAGYRAVENMARGGY
jgi:hypothetical protein